MKTSLIVFLIAGQTLWAVSYALLYLENLKLQKLITRWRPFVRAFEEVERRVNDAMDAARAENSEEMNSKFFSASKRSLQ